MDNFHIETAQNVTIQQNVANLSTRIGAFFIDAFIIGGYYLIIYLILDSLNLISGDLYLIYGLLSLPVFFYSAGEFYISAWQGVKQKFLNIDAPIVLAIWVTFFRSLYEIYTGAGGGYLDSMSGIVFFMLAGRVLQDRTQKKLSFERDYTSYFPVAVTKIDGEKRETPS